jgi:hypothetical protein
LLSAVVSPEESGKLGRRILTACGLFIVAGLLWVAYLFLFARGLS